MLELVDIKNQFISKY